MAIADDFSVSVTGDIRHTSGTTVYSVLALHAWLQDLADDAAAAGNDLLDILAPNPSKLDGPRDAAVASRLNLLTDGSVAFNIDDTAAQFINFGSIKQFCCTISNSSEVSPARCRKSLGNIASSRHVQTKALCRILIDDRKVGDTEVAATRRIKVKNVHVSVMYGSETNSPCG
jgi:hypothetical protein